MSKRVFSLPINPKLSEEFVEETFLPFLKKYRDYIFDLYFTCRIPPFMQDAMGDCFQIDEAVGTSALYISSESDIPLSATFNNLYVRPDQKNLDTWIKSFKPYYDAGVRVVTLPHTTWVSTGQIQREYPELFIKNTILREVTRANEVVALAEAGFHYVNLDRDLMRDQDQLKEIKRAKEYCERKGKPVRSQCSSMRHVGVDAQSCQSIIIIIVQELVMILSSLQVLSVEFHVLPGMCSIQNMI